MPTRPYLSSDLTPAFRMRLQAVAKVAQAGLAVAVQEAKQAKIVSLPMWLNA